MPRDICLVKYRDLDHAIANCLKVHREAGTIAFEEEISVDETDIKDDNRGHQKPIFMGKMDVQSAFCLVLLSPWSWPWLIMLAKNPITKNWQFFVDKCLPFGASISCAIFQRLSNAIWHITKFRTNQDTITNYLDDFLFVVYIRSICNDMIKEFLNICSRVGIPIAEEKTKSASNLIVFLGILLNGLSLTLGIPEEKRTQALYLLSKIVDKRKSTVRELQQLCGYLNFLNRTIYPGRPS